MKFSFKPLLKPSFLTTALFGLSLLAISSQHVMAQNTHVDTIKQYTDNVLTKGKDNKHNSPLLPSGINVTTGEPLIWVFPDGHKAILSNFSSQQNFLRLLVGLSEITGDPKYKQQATEMVKYYFANFQHENGLLFWGGHRFVDLTDLKPVGPSEKEMVHELKNAYPWYDFMFEVDEKNTGRFIQAFWNAHVYDWKTLETSRHGEYGKKPVKVWSQSFTQQPPYISTKGLSFLNAGNDLIYASFKYYQKEQDPNALLWGKRLAEQYVLARDPNTNLGVYQFTQALKRDTTTDDSNTHSKYGDRAARQFGPEFGAVALEGNMLLKGRTRTIYSENALMQLQLAQDLGADGQQLLDWTLGGMAAFANYAYQADTNTFKPMLTDGSDLTNYVLPRDGYYGKKGTVMQPYPADPDFMLSYARAYLIKPEPAFWKVVSGMGKAEGLGNLGSVPGKDMQLNFKTDNADPFILFSLIDLYQATQNQGYLQLADRVADNIIKQRYVNNLFIDEPNKQYASIDTIEPYAILMLEAVKMGKADALPPFINGSGFTEGAYLLEDGTVRISTRDNELFSLNKGDVLKPNGKK